MFAIISKALTAILTKLVFSFFTENVLSLVVIELLKKLAKKTTNTIDDRVIELVAKNMKEDVKEKVLLKGK